MPNQSCGSGTLFFCEDLWSFGLIDLHGCWPHELNHSVATMFGST